MNQQKFTLVKSKRRNQNRSIVTDNRATNTNITLSTALRRIADADLEITASQFYSETLNRLEPIITAKSPVKTIICFGIGHIATCSIARHQFAYILAIRKHFQIGQIEFHEPVLTEEEKSILTSLNCRVQCENLEGKHLIAAESTLLFLPHCPKQLTNNLLWRNWSSTRLHYMILINNSFTGILESTPKRFLEHDANYLLKAISFTIETRLPNIFRFSDIFNDLSVHCFETATVSSNIWDDTTKPTYADCTELIANLTIAV